MDPLYNKSTGGIPHNKLGCTCSEGFQELCENHDDETGDCKIALANFRNMNKKIIALRLIKKYPNMECEVGQTVPYHEMFNGYMINWPEFWEPIYEEIVDLQNITGDLHHGKKMYWDCRPFYSESHVINMIIEACRQTLELVNMRISIDPEQKKIIREIINLVK